MRTGLEIFADNLIRLRKARDLTQMVLAGRSGLSIDSIAAFEQRRVWPSKKSLTTLASALNVDEGALLLDEAQVPLETALRVVITCLGLEAPLLQPKARVKRA